MAACSLKLTFLHVEDMYLIYNNLYNDHLELITNYVPGFHLGFLSRGPGANATIPELRGGAKTI